MISEDRVPKANHHRGADGVARSTRARKRDFQGNEDSGSKRIRVTKEKSTVLIEKTLVPLESMLFHIGVMQRRDQPVMN